MSFSYVFPIDFQNRVLQILQQKPYGSQIATAFQNCCFEYEDQGLAYYAGMKGDNWDKKALDFTIEGSSEDINILKKQGIVFGNAVEMALRPSTTGFLVRNIIYLISDSSYLPASNEERLNADIKTANEVLSDLIKIGERLASNALYKSNASEDSMNDYFRDTLSLMGYDEVKDQTRHGISLSGKDAGEVDILVTKNGNEIAIFEGLKLDSVNTSYINEHINKAIVNYNALGTATFVVAYVTAQDFERFWERYSTHIKDYDFPIQVKRCFNSKTSPNAAIRIADMILSRDGYDFPVYFMAIKIL